MHNLFQRNDSILLLTIFIIIGNGILFGARGDLISSEILATRSVANTQFYIEDELSQIVTDSFSIDSAKYGYWLYKIRYETIDINGNIHIASGVVSYPRVDWPNITNQAFPIMSYQHGTVVEKSSVTSVNGEWILPAILTGSGYVYIEPDYLGLGDSEGMHPYQLKEPYGTAIVDLLRAVKYYAVFESNQFMINDQLFLVGYSEGGYATMALHHIIERDYVDEFDVTMSFPMAGAYSMSEVMVDIMLSFEPYGEPFYFPYVLFSYLNYYPSLGIAENYLLPEYYDLPGMFDGYHSSSEINNFMPAVPITIMKEDSIISFQNNMNHPLRLVLQSNDLWNWTPNAPVYLLHGIGDELVPVQNSQMAYEQFILNGSQNIEIELIPESFGGHSDVAPWALFAAYQSAKDIMIINELGDCNQDGSINILDIIELVNLIISNASWNSSNYVAWASDINEDLEINIQDIILLINEILDFN